MWDIVTFNSFITQDVLLFFYYIGVFVIPVALYYFQSYIMQKVTFVKTFKARAISFVAIFMCMELCWRMMFEVMIGYFDMHDYLYEISKKLS